MDRINASQSIPNTHALKAYGQSLRANKPLGAPGVTKTGVTKAAPTTQPQTTQQTQSVQQTAPIGRIGQTAGPRPAADPTRLVAAKVNQINLSSDVASLAGPKPVMTSAGTYSIHPSAAARNTAATGVQVGRGLDLRG